MVLHAPDRNGLLHLGDPIPGLKYLSELPFSYCGDPSASSPVVSDGYQFNLSRTIVHALSLDIVPLYMLALRWINAAPEKPVRDWPVRDCLVS